MEPQIPSPPVVPTITPSDPASPPSATSIPGNPVTTQTEAGFVYAGFWSRFFASLLDGLILSIPTSLISFMFGLIGGVVGESDPTGAVITVMSLLSSLIQFLIFAGYYMYFIGTKGQTPGKMALKVKVVKEDGGAVPGYMSAFLREVVGKFVSGLVLGLGYFWMLWDSKKQTWHDKIAHTVVIKV